MTPIAQDVTTSVEALLEPIRQDMPVGVYLRYDDLYDKIAEARRAERDLPQGVWQRATKRADWNLVEELCTEALTDQTKDLQIAVWLTEAWLHLRGLPGLSDGLELIGALHRSFALTMYPAPESAASLPLAEVDPGVEHRLNIIQWLNEKLSIQVKLLPLTSPLDTSSVPPFSLADLQSAQLEDQMIRRQVKTPDHTSRLHEFNRSLTLTPEQIMVSTSVHLQQTQKAADELENVLDDCYAGANSGLGQLRQILNDMATAIAPAIPQHARELSIARSTDGGSALTGGQEETLPSTLNPSNSISSPPPKPQLYTMPNLECGAIHSREDAYMRLHEIANYLGCIEPHSPVPYLLRRAISWGCMSFHELLPELLQDQTFLQNVGHLLHVDPLEH